MSKMIYLDNNATTALLEDVRLKIKEVLEIGPSNPASAHHAGDIARNLICSAREEVASLIGCYHDDILFASGGTEVNNWILELFSSGESVEIVTTPIEHESIRQKCEYLKVKGVKIIEIPVDYNGVVLFDKATRMIKPYTSLVSIQWVNNETGVIQPIEELGAFCRSLGVPFHTDAAQAIGKIPIGISSLPVDYLTITGHKFHAPKGIGALYKHPDAKLHPMLGGGTQESGLRPGTENLIGIVGFGKAAEIRNKTLIETQQFLSNLRNTFEQKLLNKCNGLIINSQMSSRVCNTSNILFPDVDGQALMAQLNSQDIYCSQGSACTAQIPEPSHVLLAMGLSSDEAFSSIRFSFSELNTINEIEFAAEAIADTYLKLSKYMRSIQT